MREKDRGQRERRVGELREGVISRRGLGAPDETLPFYARSSFLPIRASCHAHRSSVPANGFIGSLTAFALIVIGATLIGANPRQKPSHKYEQWRVLPVTLPMRKWGPSVLLGAGPGSI